MRLETYRGFDIVEDQGVIFVETRDGPFDAPTLERAREYIEAIIEENNALATGSFVGE